jgi:hypothetical protein
VNKWHLIFTFPLSGSTEEAPSRVVAIVPHLPDDPNHGLPKWFFEDYTAPFHHEDGRITDERWMYDSLEFWRQPDGSWKREWVPQMGPAPCWKSVSAPSDSWSPLILQNWELVLLRLASWQQRTYGGA